MSTETRRTRRRRKPMRTATIAVLGIAGLLVTTLVTAAVLGLSYVSSLASTFESNTTKIENPFPEGPRPEPLEDGSMNILLMGSDSRGDESIVGETDMSNQRSDVLMLLHIDAQRKSFYTMSIMRDSWVEIPGHGMAKVNAAFAWGGTPLTVATVENLLNTRIDHVALIDFQGFEEMTDALGGVDIDVAEGFKHEQFTYTTGLNHLTGPEALGFVRERYAFADGDYQRVKNQQLFLQSIANKAFSKSTLTDPARLASFIGATTKHLSVDAGFDAKAVLDLGISLRELRFENVHFFTMPTAGSGTSDDGQQYVTLDPTRLADLQGALSNDTMDAFLGLPPQG
ncbi:LCP family protein [Plantibacter sp. YIM 135347]|uniref:LCP family protein n=1 Tax=Plantibacter sp. YIM 135347 TaxID=3423919 RepID=UPI003D34B280